MQKGCKLKKTRLKSPPLQDCMNLQAEFDALISFLLIIYGCFHQSFEQRMWISHSTFIFRVKLYTYKPGMSCEFDNLNKIILRVNTYSHHAGIFISLQILVIKLITVTMTFFNINFIVSSVDLCSFFKCTWIN